MKNKLRKCLALLSSAKFYKIKYFYKNNVFEGNNVIRKKSNIRKCNIGRGTYIGRNCDIYNANIGRYCSIGSNVTTAIGKHPLHECISSHPAFYSTRCQAGFTFVKEEKFCELSENEILDIGDDVWIGNNVIFTKNIKVGNGSVIGAGSVVTKDIPDYAIVAGVPAKVIKYRFDEETIKKLKEINWTKWNYEIVEKRSIDFNNINEFIKKYEKEDNHE